MSYPFDPFSSDYFPVEDDLGSLCFFEKPLDEGGSSYSDANEEFLIDQIPLYHLVGDEDPGFSWVSSQLGDSGEFDIPELLLPENNCDLTSTRSQGVFQESEEARNTSSPLTSPVSSIDVSNSSVFSEENCTKPALPTPDSSVLKKTSKAKTKAKRGRRSGRKSKESCEEYVPEKVVRDSHSALPKHIKYILNSFMESHALYPYATKKDKEWLMLRTDLTEKQITQFLSNYRRRHPLRADRAKYKRSLYLKNYHVH